MTKREKQFIETVYQFYREYGRHDLPWRKTTDPYQIVVSEMMLQQTQVSRVLPKYEAFISKWPTTAALANASLAAVLVAWQGLGYNRRAKLLHRCAQVVMGECDGVWPQTHTALCGLPGIGPYTAGAVMAFAYNEPVPMVETNIRTVYLHHFFPHWTAVSEADILEKVTRTLDHENPRVWYSALMDYGTHLKQTVGNHNKRARVYSKQSIFKGSDRQIRGAVIRALTAGSKTRAALAQALDVTVTSARLQPIIDALLQEGMIEYRASKYRLPT